LYALVQPFQPTPAPLTTSLAGWMPNPSVQHPTVSAGPIGLGAPNSAGNVVPTNFILLKYVCWRFSLPNISLYGYVICHPLFRSSLVGWLSVLL